MVLLKDILHGENEFSNQDTAHKDAVVPAYSNDLFRIAARALLSQGVGDGEPVHVSWVPARIEVLGKHTDYAGGKSLLAALRRGFAFIVHKNRSNELRILDAGSNQQIVIDLENQSLQTPYSWGVYVQAVLDRVRLNFGRVAIGGTICMIGNIPPSAGMSSSSALITGLFLSLRALVSFDSHQAYRDNIQSNLQLADYLGHVENGQTYCDLVGDKGVGTFGGSQDHTAIISSKEGALRLFSFRPTQWIDEVALPAGFSFVIGSSGVQAEKTGAARDQYNRCAMLVQQILLNERINPGGRFHSLGNLIAAEGFDVEEACMHLKACEDGDSLSKRLYQCVQETSVIIPSAMKALKNDDLPRFGRLVARSHQLADTHLNNQVPETNYLVHIAQALGASACSAFGAGFGGSVWALVEADFTSSFRDEWKKRYLQRFPQWQERSAFFEDQTGQAAQ